MLLKQFSCARKKRENNVERDLFTDQILIATDSDAGVLTDTLIKNGLNPKFRRLMCHTEKLTRVGTISLKKPMK